MSLKSSYFSAGVESTFKTPAAFTRSHMIEDDNWTPRIEVLTSDNMRANKQAESSTAHTNVAKGATNSGIALDFRTEGLSQLLSGILGQAAAPVLASGATTAYEHVFTSTESASDVSWSMQQVLGTVDGQIVKDYHGVQATGFTFSNSTNGIVKFAMQATAAECVHGGSAATPTYVETGDLLHWGHGQVLIDGVDACPTQWSFSGDNKLDDDRTRICNGGALAQGVSVGTQEYSGSITVDAKTVNNYADYVAGTIVPITFRYVASEIEAGHNHGLEITLPACRIDSYSMQAGNSGYNMVDVNFKALDNGTDPVCTIKVTSTESSF